MTQEEFLALKEQVSQEESGVATPAPKSNQLQDGVGLGGYYNNLIQRFNYGARFGQSKINYLKKKYGESNVQVGQDNEPLIRKNGQWVRFNPKGLDTGDFADVAPDVLLGLIPFGGAAAKGAQVAAPALKTVLSSVAKRAAAESVAKQAITSPLINAATGVKEEGLTLNRVVDPLLSAGTAAGVVGLAATAIAAPGFAKGFIKNQVTKYANNATGGVSNEGQIAIDVAKKYGLPMPTLGQTASEPGVIGVEDYLKSTPTGRGAFDSLHEKTKKAVKNVSNTFTPQGSSVLDAGKSVVNSFQNVVKSERKIKQSFSEALTKRLDSTPGIDQRTIDISNVSYDVDKTALRRIGGETNSDAVNSVIEKTYKQSLIPRSALEEKTLSPREALNVLRDINEVLDTSNLITKTESQKELLSTYPKSRLQSYKTQILNALAEQSSSNPAAKKVLQAYKKFPEVSKPLNDLNENIINTISKNGTKPQNLVPFIFGAGKKLNSKVDKRDTVKNITNIVNFLQKNSSQESLDNLQSASIQRVFDNSSDKQGLNLSKLNNNIYEKLSELMALYADKPESKQAIKDMSDYLSVVTRGAGFGNSATASRQGFFGAVTGTISGLAGFFTGDPTRIVSEVSKTKAFNNFNKNLAEILTNRKSAIKFSEVLRNSMQSFDPKTAQRISVGGRAGNQILFGRPSDE